MGVAGLGEGSLAIAADLPKPKIRAQMESRLGFDLDRAGLATGKVQYFDELIVAPRSAQGSANFQKIRGIDFPRYWERRGENAYSVMLGSTAYVVNKPVSFYTRERALDIQRLNRLMPEFPIQKKPGAAPGVYRGKSAPACTIQIETFTRDQVQSLGSSRPELRVLEKLYPELGLPELTVIQHNFDFDRILGFRTSEGTITLSAHYDFADASAAGGQTLIVVLSLGYLHNLPPAIWGGETLVKETSRDVTLVLIERLRAE